MRAPKSSVNPARPMCSDGHSFVGRSYQVSQPYMPDVGVTTGRGPAMGKKRKQANPINEIATNPLT